MIKNKAFCIEERARHLFGETDNFECAGYMLEDGTMLNFSNNGYYRQEDHRTIGQFFKTAEGTEALNKFMKRGNIRVICNNDTYGFELIQKPTQKQMQQLRRASYIAKRKGNWFMIEQSDKNGNVIGETNLSKLERMA